MDNSNTKVVTNVPVRASFPHLFKPYAANNNSEPKYSMTILIPKEDVATLNQIKQAIENCRLMACSPGGTWKVNVAQPKVPFYDGDGVTVNGVEFGPECKGHYVLRTSSKRQPSVVDKYGEKILDSSVIYAGCYVYASLNFYAYSVQGSVGIACGLNHVMFAKDGESIGNVSSAKNDFASIIQANKAQANNSLNQAMQVPQAPVNQATQDVFAQAPVNQALQPFDDGNVPF